jgi:hypothetical protein
LRRSRRNLTTNELKIRSDDVRRCGVTLWGSFFTLRHGIYAIQMRVKLLLTGFVPINRASNSINPTQCELEHWIWAAWHKMPHMTHLFAPWILGKVLALVVIC